MRALKTVLPTTYLIKKTAEKYQVLTIKSIHGDRSTRNIALTDGLMDEVVGNQMLFKLKLKEYTLKMPH